MKYLLIILIIYFFASKIPVDKLPGNNPFIVTLIVAIIIYLLDQPNVLFDSSTEHYNQIHLNNNIITKIVEETINKMPKEHFENNINATTTQPLTPPTTPPNIVVESLNKIQEQANVKPIKSENENNKNVNNQDIMMSGLPSKSSIITDVVNKNNAENCDCNDIADKAITKFLKNRRILDKNGMLHYADDYFGDMGYSQLRLDNYIPLGASGEGVYDNWDLSQYSVLNTERWKPSSKNQAHCKTDVMPDPQPVDSKMPLNLMNWNYSRKVMPHDEINVEYIKEKLNN
jgi:hypothetical protein